jgi:hypothetical protein
VATYNPAPSVAAGPGVRQATAWLVRHGAPGVVPSPLLVARLRARRRVAAALLAVLVVIALGAVMTVGRLGTGSYEAYRRTQLTRLTGDLALVLLVVSLRWLMLRALRKADHRIAGSLPRRAAHPRPVGWQTVLGRPRLTISAVGYGGALAIGIAGAMLARTAQDRTMVAVLLTGATALAAITVAEVVDVVRRPAIAEDALSLAVDDALRGDDARLITDPLLPVMLAVLTAASLSPSVTSSLMGPCWTLLGLTALASIVDSALPPPVKVAVTPA